MTVYNGALKRKMVDTIVQFMVDADPNLEVREDDDGFTELFDHDGNWGFRVSNLVDHLIGDIIS